MAPLPTILPNIRMDWDQQASVLSGITAGQWQEGINRTLGYLYYSPPNVTSRAVLSAYLNTGKSILITPAQQTFGADHIGRNAGADPDDPLTATAKGKKPEGGTPGSGIGGGSNARITFTAQDWSPVSERNQLGIEDEALLHECVHALRQAMGTEDDATLAAPFERLRRSDKPQTPEQFADKYAQSYGNIEEFIAILITNIYRSENDRIGLVRDHLGDHALAPPLTNPRNFLSVWRPQIVRLCTEMPKLCDILAAVSCDFNPIFELYAATDRFMPGGRGVKFGAGARAF